MSADLELLDGALPLVRFEPWTWFVMFWEDASETTPSDLTGKAVTAEVRWAGGAETVAVSAVDAGLGRFELSLLAQQTEAMPLGRLAKLYLAVDGDTEAVVPADVLEGLSQEAAPIP